jgi:hypothetical protein
LIWNIRKTTGSAFLELYEQLVQTFGNDYKQVNHRNITKQTLQSFFKDSLFHEAKFTIHQRFDFESLKGRLLSSSYTPTPDQPNYYPMLSELRAIFDNNQQSGTVSIDYETEIYVGEV